MESTTQPSSSLSLLTDLYQLTMAYGYWKKGKANDEAVFNLYFRKHPFKGGFTVSCGLHSVIEYLSAYKITDEEVEYLRDIKGADGNCLFEEGFLDYLKTLENTLDIDAIPEGTVVFPNEPLLRVKGPILLCQLIETPLLNLVNFETLIATKAARVRMVAPEDTLLEFGLRRAQGPNGGVTASRASYVGGFDATSNVLAGKKYGIPVKGTHAHSWVMSFESELASFQAYADVQPNNSTLLVDTFDTIQGVKHAITVGKELRKNGHDLLGIRLDSGDLAYLSIESRKLLDAAGFEKTAIVASNDLDEHIISSLKEQGAKITVWGVGTKLVTAYDQPALGGVYKLAALKNKQGDWEYKMKLSEQAIKVSTPGIQQVRRYTNENGAVADMIYNEEDQAPTEAVMIDPYDFTKRKRFGAETSYEDLLVPIYRKGKLVYELPSIELTKKRVTAQLGLFAKGIKRLVNPHIYPVGLEEKLFDMKTDLIVKYRNQSV